MVLYTYLYLYDFIKSIYSTHLTQPSPHAYAYILYTNGYFRKNVNLQIYGQFFKHPEKRSLGAEMPPSY